MLEAAKKHTPKMPPVAVQSPAALYQAQLAQSSSLSPSTRNLIIGAAAVLVVGGLVFYMLQRKGKK